MSADPFKNTRPVGGDRIGRPEPVPSPERSEDFVCEVGDCASAGTVEGVCEETGEPFRLCKSCAAALDPASASVSDGEPNAWLELRSAIDDLYDGGPLSGCIAGLEHADRLARLLRACLVLVDREPAPSAGDAEREAGERERLLNRGNVIAQSVRNAFDLVVHDRVDLAVLADQVEQLRVWARDVRDSAIAERHRPAPAPSDVQEDE